MTTQCKHAASGCNYPEGECLGVCMESKPQKTPMKTTIPNWTGQSCITLELMQATDTRHLASISHHSEGLSFFHAMNEEGLSKLICDAIQIRNLMRLSQGKS